jgi:hypothetical protein
MTTEAPDWTACASPQNQGYYNGHPVASPSSNNHYRSPAVSPGDWNVTSPNSSASSPQDGSHYSYDSPNSSVYGSSNGSVPSNTPSSVSSSSTSGPLELPAELGKTQVKKSALEHRREKIANAKALDLMKQNFGSCTEGPTTPRPQVRSGSLTAKQAAAMRDEESNKMKSALEHRREKIANAKALGLMKQNFGSCTEGPTTPRPQVRSGSLTAKQAAAERDEESNKMKIESHVRYQEQKKLAKPAPTLVPRARKEKLATSTRKIKKPTAEEDFETVNDYKCQLDFEREEWAQKKALALLAKFGY